MNSHNMQESEKVPIIKNWLDFEGLRLVQTVRRKSAGQFEVLSEKFSPQHREIML